MNYLRKISVALIFFTGVLTASAQNNLVAGLKEKLSKAADDTTKAHVLDSLSMYYMFYTKRYDSSFYYANQAINNAFLIKDKKYLILAYARVGFYYFNTSRYNAGLTIALKGLQLAERYNIHDYSATLYYDISFTYFNLGDSAKSMQNALKGVQEFGNNKDPFYDIPLHLYGHISSIYASGDNNDSALIYLHKLDSVSLISKERAGRDIDYYYWTIFYLNNTDYVKADSVIALGVAACKSSGDFLLNAFYLFRTRSLFRQHRYQETITAAGFTSDMIGLASRSSILSYVQQSYYKLGNIDSAYFYQNAADSVQAVVQDQSNIYEAQQLLFDQEITNKENQASMVLEKERGKSRQIIYIFLTAILIFLLFGFIQWNNNRNKKKANILLMREKEKVETALSELKSAQAQLIQSEKMASLGELTAGIAHEIQNPLNFVNNFSEVNKELLEELKEEADKGNINEIKTIANDVIENSEKINHHGKRADAIVKGMLQHSQSGKGVKEPTDMNALCDEYLKLSYHGLRAKDKNFNADLKTDFDNNINKINVIPQDISRVLLNLINNALYAVNDKKKTADENYQPVVFVQTKKINNNVEIKVSDNGNGIPSTIINKIFQPFFTTKPTGQGTGLGLSLSYDIIKAHDGLIKVESKEGEGTTFIIRLPVV